MRDLQRLSPAQMLRLSAAAAPQRAARRLLQAGGPQVGSCSMLPITSRSQAHCYRMQLFFWSLQHQVPLHVHSKIQLQRLLPPAPMPSGPHPSDFAMQVGGFQAAKYFTYVFMALAIAVVGMMCVLCGLHCVRRLR